MTQIQSRFRCPYRSLITFESASSLDLQYTCTILGFPMRPPPPDRARFSASPWKKYYFHPSMYSPFMAFKTRLSRIRLPFPIPRGTHGIHMVKNVDRFWSDFLAEPRPQPPKWPYCPFQTPSLLWRPFSILSSEFCRC